MNNLLKGSWQLAGAVLGAFLLVLGLFSEAWRSKNTIKKQYETHVFEIFCFRYLSSLRTVWEAIFSQFGVALDFKFGAKPN